MHSLSPFHLLKKNEGELRQEYIKRLHVQYADGIYSKKNNADGIKHLAYWKGMANALSWKWLICPNFEPRTSTDLAWNSYLG